VSKFEHKLRLGGRPDWLGLLTVSVLIEFAAVLLFLLCAVPTAKILGGWWWRWAPVREGAAFAWRAAPALAVVGAVYSLKPQ
jgi:hypothetical protein